MEIELEELINSLDSNQLVNFLKSYNEFYKDTKTLKSKYINELNMIVSSICLKRLNEEDKINLKENNIDVIGGCPLKLMKWWYKCKKTN